MVIGTPSFSISLISPDNTMSQIKPNQIPKIKFNDERIRKILPKSLTEEKIEDYVVEAISFYNKYLKQRKREAR